MPGSSIEPAGDDPLAAARQLTALESELRGLDNPVRAPALAGRIVELGRLAGAGAGEGVGDGAGGLFASRLLSRLNDLLTARLIELGALRHRLPPVRWCWLALGSEGRAEQTFVTDQDNGLVFQAADQREAEALRVLFLPFADDLNQQLAACGFALCAGQVMAGNAAWCLSLDEWRDQFIDWVRRPEPAALLNASIFFDLRPLYGDAALAANLRRLLLALTVDTPAFLHLMAVNALHAEVPLNFRGEVVADAQGEIDLKKFGSRIFVDAARIFALAAGVPAVDTDGRLATAATLAGMPADEVVSARAAFGHVLRLRLQQQAAVAALGEPVGHGLKVAALNEMDRVILREALRQARRLQQRLKLNYAL
jgi:CBS domain-containing protein